LAMVAAYAKCCIEVVCVGDSEARTRGYDGGLGGQRWALLASPWENRG
jgi:hypothetical protein